MTPSSETGVVIPAWNRARLTVQAVASVVAQTSSPAALVVVDDGSTDGTARAVSTWLDAHRPPFAWTVLEQPNRGAAAARNAGLATLGECPLVAFLDSDDAWPADFLERTTAALASRPEAVAASTDRVRVDVAAGTRTRDDLAELARDPLAFLFRFGAGIGSATLLRAEAVRAVGGFPEAVVSGHDLLLFGRIAVRGTWLHCPGEPVTFLRNHAVSSGEADHIEARLPNRELTWVRLYEQLAREVGRGRLSRRVYRRTVADRWIGASRLALNRGARREARACILRALWLRPRKRAYWRALFGSLRETNP